MNRLIPKPIKVQENISTAGINQPKACFRVFVVLIVGSEGKEESPFLVGSSEAGSGFDSGSGLLNEKYFPKLVQIACFFLPSLRLVHSAHVQAGGWLSILGLYSPASLLSIVACPHDANTMRILYHKIRKPGHPVEVIPTVNNSF